MRNKYRRKKVTKKKVTKKEVTKKSTSLSIPLSKKTKKKLINLKIKKSVTIPVSNIKKTENYNVLLKKIKKPNIYILYTGGTIGEIVSKAGYLVPATKLNKLIKNINIENSLDINYTIDVDKKIIDSANLRTADWKNLIIRLQNNYDKYDSFIILHGTDTLAYTASALSFFLKDWNKPVIVTGSQIPLFEFRNDAVRNIINSLIFSLTKIIGVHIVFGGTVLRGNRSTKFSSTRFEAFESPNFGPVATFNVILRVNKNRLLIKDTLVYNSFKWNISEWTNDINIVTYTLLPQENGKPLENIIKQKPNAIILRTYGIGNGPVADSKFMSAIKDAIKKNIIVVNESQCVHGGINMDYYRSGRLLKQAGVLTSVNMTLECIFAKLFYLFQLYDNNIKTIKNLFLANLAGELDEDKEHLTVSNNLKQYFKIYQEI
jgi:L-asparaginase